MDVELSCRRIEGGCALSRGWRIDQNPYDDGTPEHKAWADGYERQIRFEEKYGYRSFTCDADTVSVGATTSVATDGPARRRRDAHHPGRGRSIMGPRREWRESEIAEMLASAREGMKAPAIAAQLKRSSQAVRSKLSRLRKEGVV